MTRLPSVSLGTATRVSGKTSKLSDNQKSVLESFFTIDCYPNRTTIKELAQQTMLNEKTIRNWFTRKRGMLRLREWQETQSNCEYVC